MSYHNHDYDENNNRRSLPTTAAQAKQEPFQSNEAVLISMMQYIRRRAWRDGFESEAELSRYLDKIYEVADTTLKQIGADEQGTAQG